MTHDNAHYSSAPLVAEIVTLRQAARTMVDAMKALARITPGGSLCWCPSDFPDHEPKCVAAWKAVSDAERLLG